MGKETKTTLTKRVSWWGGQTTDVPTHGGTGKHRGGVSPEGAVGWGGVQRTLGVRDTSKQAQRRAL